MKIKSLILGSVAAAGLSTGAMAADLGTVLTALDVCDALGISGLTISSDTNCLQISGGVAYSFSWGDYAGSTVYAVNTFTGNSITIMAPNGAVGTELDWESHVDAWLKFVGTADSSFGPASATIVLGYDNDYTVVNEGTGVSGTQTDTSGRWFSSTSALVVDEAFVQIGDGTVLMAGMKGSIANLGDDAPFNYLGLFNSEMVDVGVGGATAFLGTGGHVIQVVSDLGNGVSVGAALENINSGTVAGDGTAVGVIAYDGDGISAHATFLAGGILDGTVENWGIHAGVTAEMDMYKIRGAVAADNTGYWNVLGTAEASFDMFTLAVSGEAAAGAGATTQAGVGGSISADVTDGVTINLGARWWDMNLAAANTETAEVKAELIASVTETITISGSVGAIARNFGGSPSTIYFGGELAWAPGGGFDASIGAQANSDGAYKVTFDASKDFE